ncbi:MAG TPA: SagB family peptide dehydrogenase [Gaiellaceae bacterium]
MSGVLGYHRATNVAAHGTDEDEARMVDTRPSPFKDYGHAERLPLEGSLAGPLLQDAAGIVRSQPRRDYGGGTIHWRAYSSAGALYPIEMYVAATDGLFAFDVMTPAFVALRRDDARQLLAEAAAEPELAEAGAVVVVTGIHGRTGWKYLERGYRHVWWDAGTMLANLLALAAADGLEPRLYVGFVDREVNELLGVDGTDEYALALVALGNGGAVPERPPPRPKAAFWDSPLPGTAPRYPLAEAAHEASSFGDADEVRAWRTPDAASEPKLDRDALVDAIRRRRSVRQYAPAPLPAQDLRKLLAWSEAPIPTDAPSVVRQAVTVAAVEGLEPGIYDAELGLLSRRDEPELRTAVGFAAMEQEHPRDAAVNVFQVGDIDAIVARLGPRGYRWAQLEAGIRAGRLQVGAFLYGWGAAASTFFDDEVSKLLDTQDSPLLMVAIGAR